MKARQGKARQGKARQGKARQGKARQGVRNMAFLGSILCFICFISFNQHASCNNNNNTEEILLGVDPPPLTLSKRLNSSYIALQTFKKQISNHTYKFTHNWSGYNVCAYKGVECATFPDDNTTAVYGVDFNSFHFRGLYGYLGLDLIINSIPELSFLHVSSNSFTGTIPPIKYPRYFYELDVSNNKLTGTFPDEVLGAQNLTYLDLRFNQFQGPINPSVFDLDLQILFLNNNEFNGNIPEQMGNTPAQLVTLANNNLTGPIPSSIGRAAYSLIEVLFSNNSLSGKLPDEICLLQNLTVFDASYNEIRSPLPANLSNLVHMQSFNLSHNKLYGNVSAGICKISNLTALSLSYNYFKYLDSSCLDLNQTVANFSMNCIAKQPNQRSKTECDAFYKEIKIAPPNEGQMDRINEEFNKNRNEELNRPIMKRKGRKGRKGWRGGVGLTYQALKPNSKWTDKGWE